MASVCGELRGRRGGRRSRRVSGAFCPGGAGDVLQAKTGFLVVGGFEDVAYDRSGKMAVLAALPQRRDDDLRIISLTEAYKPAVIQRFPLVALGVGIRRGLSAA